MTIARTPAQTLAGEATSGSQAERWADMVAIASVAYNRAAMLGVSVDDVMGVQSQFNAYNKQMPPGTQNYVDMAQQALDFVATNGPINQATFYSTPETQTNLPDGLQQVDSTSGHVFMTDPANRAIITAQGAIQPDPTKMPTSDPLQQAINQPYSANGLTNGISSLTNAPVAAITSQSLPAAKVDPAFQPNGLLAGAPPVSSFTAPASAPMGVLATGDYSTPNFGPTLNSFAPMANAGVPGGEYASVNERTGLAPEGFDPSRLSGPVNPAASQMAQVMQTPTATLDAPEAHPNVNMFADLAAAPPVQAPMDVSAALGAMNQPQLSASTGFPMAASLFSPAVATQSVQASPTGLLGAQPDLSAQAKVNPSLQATPTGILGASPQLDASATAIPGQAPTTSQYGDINSPTMQAMKASVAAQLAGMPAPASFSQSPMNTYSGIKDYLNASNVAQQNALATPAYNQSLASNIPTLSRPLNISNPFDASTGLISPPDDPSKTAQIANAAASLAGMPTGLQSGYQTPQGLLSSPLSSQSQANSLVAAIDQAKANALAAPNFETASANNIPGLSRPLNITTPFDASTGLIAPADDPAKAAQIAATVAAYTATPSITPAQNAITAASPTNAVDPSIAGYQQMANTGLLAGIPNLSANAVAPTISAPASNGIPMSNIQYAGDMSMLNSGFHLPTANVPSLASNGLLSAPASIQSIVNPTTVPGASIPSVNAPAFNMTQAPISTPSLTSTAPVDVAQDPAVSMPSLPTVSVPDQPTVAAPTDTTTANTVQGPATTTASQQKALTGSFPATPTKNPFSGMFNGGMFAGGLLGSLTAGPVGGALGGLLGGQISKNGGLSGLLGGSAPNINQIPGGMANLAGIWSGGFPTGTQALASDGQHVTDLGGGWTSVTNKYGVTTSFGPNGLTAGYFGPDLTGGDSHTPGGTPGGGGGYGPGLL